MSVTSAFYSCMLILLTQFNFIVKSTCLLHVHDRYFTLVHVLRYCFVMVIKRTATRNASRAVVPKTFGAGRWAWTLDPLTERSS